MNAIHGWRLELLDNVSEIMTELALEGLDEELSSHAYTNRTGNLEGSTRVETYFQDGAVVELIMGGLGGSEDYAEWIVENDWSDFENIAEDVGRKIGARLSR